MEKKYSLVIDQSTSATKMFLVNERGFISERRIKHQQIFPEQGWVEHDPLEIMENVYTLFEQLLKENNIKDEEIKQISITNQRETIIAWNKQTGKPLYNAIVWQCNRTSNICEELIDKGFSELIHQKTGLRIDPYFSGTKIKWLLDNVYDVQATKEKNELAVGTIDSWLLWNLTENHQFVTEQTNACRTLLYNIEKNCWDQELMEIFDVTRDMLPEIIDSSEVFGYYKGIPICGVMADSQAALYGQSSKEEGDLKITLGTGSSIMLQLCQNGQYRDCKQLTTLAWKEHGKYFYTLEAIIRSCADSLNWMEDNLVMFKDIRQSSNEVLTTQRQEKVYFVPALHGLGTPFWQKDATAMFFGMKRSTTRQDLLVSVLESIIFQVKAVIESLEESPSIQVSTIRVDGGVSNNKKLMASLVDLLEKPITISKLSNLSAIGALKMSGENADFVNGESIELLPKENVYIKKKYQQWKTIVELNNSLKSTVI